MRKPEVLIKEITLLCPVCGTELKTNICQNCACEIDLSEITLDIQPSEILDCE